MNRITNSLIICFFTLLAINGNAQEKFMTYDNTNNGKKYDILVSVEGNAIFSLWINAMPLDDLYQTGGIIIRERNYYKFLDDIELAKQQYEELVKTAKTEKVKSFDKMMRINSKADAYFKSGNWNLQYDVPLNFEFKVKESHGELNYLLFISTGELTALNNSSVKSAGYGLVFSSTEEIDRFTQQISSEKIYDFVARIDTGFVAKRRNIARSRYLNKPRSGLFSKITVGVKAGYTTL